MRVRPVARALSVMLGLALGCHPDGPPAFPVYDPPGTSTTGTAPLVVSSVDPGVIDPNGGSRLTIHGSGFVEAFNPPHPAVGGVTIGGVSVRSLAVRTDTAIDVVTDETPPGEDLDVVVRRGELDATLADAVDCWSPAELPGARVFDAARGLVVEEAVTTYEWQRLTADLHPDWRVRDGNTLTWLPAAGRFVMVAGWNPYDEPQGFGSTTTTTDEVWSSADGVTWTQDLPHGHAAFERRHSHNTVLWNDRLWMIGGDTWQGYYNHDVVSSADGVTWTVELGPGTTDPPWSERGLQTIGVYDGKLWMAGGQDLLGDPVDYVFHNDVWNTEDGVTWTQVAADGPASPTRWAGCGVLDGLVEFRGELWLVGCAQARANAQGHSMSNEVWSTVDGVTWTLHATPPWAGKIWPNVVVWDDKLWILFGYTYGDPANGWPAGNSNEAWYSEDGETWRSLPHDAPVPGSHGQGVAVTPDALVLAGGNYGFGFGAGEDKSVWRLVPFHGDAVASWTDRGDGGLVATAAADVNRPVLVADAFGEGVPGVQFDGSESVLALAAADTQSAGRSVLWVARAPYLPAPWGFEETYAPLGTLVGGAVYGGLLSASVGLSDGAVTLLNLDDELGAYGEPLYTRVAGGELLQEGPGEARFAGLTHTADGTVQVYVDGVATGDPLAATYGTGRSWSQLGGGLEGPYYGPNSRFAGTVGALIVLPEAADPATVERIHAWARGRFGVP